MKLRSQTEVQNFLDKNLSHRKRELTTLRLLISNSHREHEKSVLLRTGVPLLYAHWEGFIKSSASAYLDFVSYQKIPLMELHYNFIALACRSEILSSAQTKKVGIHTHIINFVFEKMTQSVLLKTEGAIDTEHNLSSRVFKDIMQTVGFNYGVSWESKSLWIDGQLIKYRNEIAHGELSVIDESMYGELHIHVIKALDEFKTEIENAMATKAYLR